MSDKNQVKSERCRKECVMRFSDMHVHSTFSSDGKSSMNGSFDVPIGNITLHANNRNPFQKNRLPLG